MEEADTEAARSEQRVHAARRGNRIRKHKRLPASPRQKVGQPFKLGLWLQDLHALLDQAQAGALHVRAMAC